MISAGRRTPGKPALGAPPRPAPPACRGRRRRGGPPRAWRGPTASRPVRTPCRTPPPPAGAAPRLERERIVRARGPSGVALITTPALRRRRRSRPRARATQRSNAPARSADRDETATRDAARSPPRPPRRGRRRRCRRSATGPAGGSSGSSAASRPSTSVLSPDTRAVLAPEHVAGARRSSASSSRRSTARAATSLCGTVTLPPPPGAGQRLDQRGDVVGGAAEGDVDRPESEGAEGGVLHGGREGVRDRVAEEGEDAGAAVDHRTMPATRLTTLPIRSCSSAKVAR